MKIDILYCNFRVNINHYRFDIGSGAKTLLNLLLSKTKNIDYVLLQPAGGLGLIGYYNSIGFNGPINILLPSMGQDIKIMYGKLLKMLCMLQLMIMVEQLIGQK